MKLRLSRSLFTVILFLACAALVSLIQAQSEEAPNKCSTDWDFCNSGTEEENAYYWRLGWCAAAIERGAVEASPSACMNQPEGTVTFPPSTRRMVDASFEDVPINPEGNNACYDWGDVCTSGTEEENEYHWQLGWCVYAVYTRSTWVSVSSCMGQAEGSVSYPAWSAPAHLVNPSRPDSPGVPPRKVRRSGDLIVIGPPEGMVCWLYVFTGINAHEYECRRWGPEKYNPNPEPTEEP